MTTSVQLKIQAHREWADYLERGDKLRATFQRAGMPVPEELRMLLGTVTPAQATIPIFRPSPPPDAGDDWIWIDIPSASITTLMLAILNGAKVPMNPRTILEKVVECGEPHNGTVINTLYNAIKRLESTVLTRNEDGTVSLKHEEDMPVLFEGRVWGPVSVFPSNSELAAHRRDAEIFTLKKNGPLQQMQLVRILAQHDLLNRAIPVRKDLVKGDLELMNGKRVRRVAGSKKWEAIQ